MNKINIKALLIILFVMAMLILNSFFKEIFNDYTLVLFLGIILGICIFLFGMPRNKSRYRDDMILNVLMFVIAYYLVIYLLGLFVGFNYNVYNTSFAGIMKNIIPIILNVLVVELLRSVVSKKVDSSLLGLLLMVVTFVLTDVTFSIRAINMKEFNTFLDNMGLYILPSFSVSFLVTYLTKKVGFIPSLLYRLLMTLPLYFVPFVPAFGNYVWSVINICMPIVFLSRTYLFFTKQESAREKILVKSSVKKSRRVQAVIDAFILAFLFVLVALTSGLFKLQLLVISTGSMEPWIYRGDTVLVVKKTKEEVKNLEVGQILVYRADGKIICHRIYSKIVSGKELFFRTKGDNNNTADNYLVDAKDVIGITDFKIKFIGLPTVWLNDLLEGKEV